MNDKLFYDLLKLVYEYSSNGKLVDSEFYKKVWFLFKGNIKTDKYLNELVLINSTNEDDPKYSRYVEGLNLLFGHAAYDYRDKNLVIYEDNLQRDNKNLVAVPELSESDKILFFNLLIMQTLLHEYEHVLQEVKKNNGTDYESQLLRSVYSSAPETFSSYEYSVYERLAEINSCNLILKMIESIGFGSQYIYNYFYNRLNNVLKGGYHFEDDKGDVTSKSTGIFVSPTEVYARMRGKDIKLFMEQVTSLDERIIYGLPISVEEYNRKFNGDSHNLKV